MRNTLNDLITLSLPTVPIPCHFVPCAASPQGSRRELPAEGRADSPGPTALLAAGTDVNARDGQGWTTLMHAANKGHTLLVTPLVEARADAKGTCRNRRFACLRLNNCRQMRQLSPSQRRKNARR